jgi:predicted dehydrogenase
MNKKVKWGIVGLGNIAHKFGRDLQLSQNSVLQGVASRDLEKAKTFAQKFGAVNAYGSYLELVKDPEIDIVYIATPHALHFENTLMCLENGKSVLCEKPLGLDANQAKTMIEIARAKNLFLMEGLWTRFIPATEKVLELLDTKVIGDLLYVRADFGFKAPINPKGRIYNKNLGGGSLLDIGIYPIYISLLTLGVPRSINATRRLSETGIDTFCAMLFDYENGTKAILESTFEANTPTEAFIYGSKGFIKMHGPFHHAQKLTLQLYGEVAQEFNLPITGEGYLYEIDEVVACLRNGQTENNKHPYSFSLQMSTVLDRVKEKIGLSYHQA